MEKLAKTLQGLQIRYQELKKNLRVQSQDSTSWGEITGTLANQTDLTTALSGKAATNHTQAFTTVTGTATAAQIPVLDTAKITTGTFVIARIPTGTSSTTVSLGNHTHDITAFTTVPGYNATLTQTLKHVSGVLTWVTG